MTEQAIDTSDMYAIHDCLRHEFARLPITVKAVGEGDAERAAVVGGHVLLMTDILNSHHTAEDVIVWPTLTERAPESAPLVAELSGQHEALHTAIASAREQADAWMQAPGNQERARLHTTLIGLERSLLQHLALEEQEALPIVQSTLTFDEYASIGEHARASLPPELMGIVLGLILDNTSRERADAIMGSMPPEAVAGFEQFGRPAYAEYKARITDY
jgi:iron-sulfur cluster repair protein YtfE (RIC family)